MMIAFEQDARITGRNPMFDAAEEQAYEAAMERGRERARLLRRERLTRRKHHKI
jgi:hypothetical protein